MDTLVSGLGDLTDGTGILEFTGETRLGCGMKDADFLWVWIEGEGGVMREVVEGFAKGDVRLLGGVEKDEEGKLVKIETTGLDGAATGDNENVFALVGRGREE